MNGCSEHNAVLFELFQNATMLKRTLNFTTFDLADAFGSVPHNLISHCLKYYNIPGEISEYVLHVYSKIKGNVTTKD